MATQGEFAIFFSPEAIVHLDHIEAKHHRLIQERIESQLSHRADVATRNRKPLRLPAPFGAAWELRFGPQNCFRVLYDVNSDEHTVSILAIGVKEGSRLIVGGEEVSQ
jgi:mRNA-degrading endonuclease RelE of RelBE toxin-antitoxin system